MSQAPSDSAADSPADSPEPATASAEPRGRLYLIDGFSVIFRAFYAIRHLSAADGTPTNAVFGFLQILRKLLRDEKPGFLGIAMDASSDTVRKEKYEDYKANRKPMPEDLRPQIPMIREVIEAYGIPMVEMQKYEADDVLGTLAAKAKAEGYEVILVSPDKDLMQLVGDGVFMYHTGRDKLYDAEGVTEDFGVPPHQVVDVLALMGDSSDNVPGVPGIGEKGAKKLIAEHGSLEALLDAAESVKRKAYREGLIDHRDKAILSQELVTIHRDLEIELDMEAFAMGQPDWKAMLELCRRLDFHQLAREIEEAQGAETPPPQAAEELTTAAAFAEFAATVDQEVDEVGGRALAVAMLGEPLHETRVLGLAFALAQVGGGEGDGEDDGPQQDGAVYVDFRRDGLKDAVLEKLRAWVSHPECRLVGHDLKEVLRLLGPRPDVGCVLEDHMLISYLHRSALRSHDFAAVVADRLHVSNMTLADAGFSKGDLPMVGDSRVSALAAERVILPLRLSASTSLQDTALQSVYDRLEAPLVPILSTMEENGILVDSEFLAGMSGELADELKDVEEKIYEIAGEPFNIQSPKQLGEIMFVKLE